jgi:hypothetical protein
MIVLGRLLLRSRAGEELVQRGEHGGGCLTGLRWQKLGFELGRQGSCECWAYKRIVARESIALHSHTAERRRRRQRRQRQDGRIAEEKCKKLQAENRFPVAFFAKPKRGHECLFADGRGDDSDQGDSERRRSQGFVTISIAVSGCKFRIHVWYGGSVGSYNYWIC